MSPQGVTSFLDAAAAPEDMAAFAAVRKAGGLTARAHFQPLIEPAEAGDPVGAVSRVVALAKQYDEGAIVVAPGITVRNAKLFLDGVISAPAFMGAVSEPYLINAGTAANPRWVPGSSRGPAVYFPAPALAAVLVELGRAGIDPHMHADGDGAVHAALDGSRPSARLCPPPTFVRRSRTMKSSSLRIFPAISCLEPYRYCRYSGRSLPGTRWD